MEIRLWGIAKGSGVEIERSDVFHLWTFRDGKAQRCEVYFNRPDALEPPAVGVALWTRALRPVSTTRVGGIQPTQRAHT